MRTLSSISNIADNYLKAGLKRRILVRIPDLNLEMDTDIKNSGTIIKSFKPFGGLEQVSNLSIKQLVLGEDVLFCTEATITRKDEGALKGAGRMLNYGSTYTTVRNADDATQFATPSITVGQLYIDEYNIFRGFMQFDIPDVDDNGDDFASCEEATIHLAGMANYSTTDFNLVLVEGNWSALGSGGVGDIGLYNDFEGHESSGVYSVTALNDTFNSSEYLAYDEDNPDNERWNMLRLNAAGKALITAAAGSTIRFMILSSIDIANTPPTGNEFINFIASTVELRLRYNTKKLDNQETHVYLYYDDGNPPTSYTDMLEIYRGVVDNYAVTNETLDLDLMSSDRKKNLLLPQTALTKESYPNMDDRDVGKPIPIIYGDFYTAVYHKEGIAYVQNEDTSEQLAHRDYIKSYTHDPSTARSLIAGHKIKEIDIMAAVWEPSNRAFAMIAGDVSAVGGENNKQFALASGNDKTKFPYALTTAKGSLVPIFCFIPNRETGSVADDDMYPVDEDVTNYMTVNGDEASPIWWFNLDYKSYGDKELFTNRYVTYYIDLINVDGDDPAMVVTCYKLGGTENKSWSIASSGAGWYEIDATDVPGTGTLAFSIWFDLKSAGDEIRVYNVSLSVGMKMDIEEIFMSCRGRYAEDTKITSLNAVFENPSHIVESIARHEIGLVDADINTSLFDTSATTLTNWKFAFQILDHIRINDLLDKLGEQCKSSIYRDINDDLSMIVWDPTAAFPHSETDIPGDLDIFQEKATLSESSGDEIMTRNPILHGSFVLDQVPANQVYNVFELRYKENYATGSYDEIITMDNGEGTVGSVSTTLVSGDESYMENSQTITGLKTLCAGSYTDLDNTTRTMTYRADYVRDRATAVKLFQHLVESYCPRKYIARFETMENALWVENGDIANIRHDRIYNLIGTATGDRKKWFVYNIKQNVRTGIFNIIAIEA